MGEIYTGLHDRLVALATVIAGESDAEDIVHDVFVRVMERPHNIQDAEKYFVRAVVNTAIDFCRRSGRQVNMSDIDGLVA